MCTGRWVAREARGTGRGADASAGGAFPVRGDLSHGAAVASVIGAVHAMVVHKHLMDRLFAFELHDVHAGETRPRAGRRSRIHWLDGHPLGKEIELHCTECDGVTTLRRGRKDTRVAAPATARDLGAMLIEACIDSIGDALAAERAGAGRVELCANLLEGGTTPSTGLIRSCVAHLRIPVFVMIRPRGGDFLYSAAEIEVMLRDIESARASGAHGIVSGALHANGTIDEAATEVLLEATAPLPFTCHRAFDLTRDLDESLDVLMASGAARVLTSGGAVTALEGAPALTRLRERAGRRLTLIAGGGVRAAHIAALATETGIREFHIGARRPAGSRMRHQPIADVTKSLSIGDGMWYEADATELTASAAALKSMP